MSDETEEKSKNNIKETIDSVTSLVKAVPVYEDAIQPAAKETGKALKTVGEAVNTALLPVKGFVWCFDQIEHFVKTKVAKKLEDVPIEDIISPELSVAGPTLESLRYTGHNKVLSELYANLLASAMDSKTAKTAHPSFVGIIKNMSSDDAKIFECVTKNGDTPVVDIRRVSIKDGSYFVARSLVSTIGNDAQCQYPEMSNSSLINLERLGLIEIFRESHLSGDNNYDKILTSQSFQDELESINSESTKHRADVRKYFVSTTVFGVQFNRACVESRDKN